MNLLSIPVKPEMVSVAAFGIYVPFEMIFGAQSSRGRQKLSTSKRSDRMQYGHACVQGGKLLCSALHEQ